MLPEITAGVNVVRKMLDKRIAADKLDTFAVSLTSILQTRYTGNWRPSNPTYGNAYRSIHTTTDRLDPVLQTAAREASIALTDLVVALPSTLTVWIDPKEVSFRIGTRGPICQTTLPTPTTTLTTTTTTSSSSSSLSSVNAPANTNAAYNLNNTTTTTITTDTTTAATTTAITTTTTTASTSETMTPPSSPMVKAHNTTATTTAATPKSPLLPLPLSRRPSESTIPTSPSRTPSRDNLIGSPQRVRRQSSFDLPRTDSRLSLGSMSMNGGMGMSMNGGMGMSMNGGMPRTPSRMLVLGPVPEAINAAAVMASSPHRRNSTMDITYQHSPYPLVF